MSQSGYLLDSNDLYTTYGLLVQKTMGFLDQPRRKGITEQSWLDEDGEDPFLETTDIYFGGRDITLLCLLKDTSMANVITKLTALKTLLRTTGLRTLTIPFLASTLSVYFKAGFRADVLSANTDNPVVVRLRLTLHEPDPGVGGTSVSTKFKGPMLIPGRLIANVDYGVFKFPVDVTISRVQISAMRNAVGDATIEVRNAAGGTGDSITVTISNGSNSGLIVSDLSISTTQAMYIRPTVPAGLTNIQVSWWEET